MSEYLERAEEKMMTVIENLEGNFATIRTGRANAKILDRVRVDYYGEPMPINQIARISVVEGTQLVIKPYDRTQVKPITHAISAANLGLTPQAEADAIRILVPQLTEDRRKELTKVAKKYTEEAKVAIRNIRRDVNDGLKKLEKDKLLSEDELKKAMDDIQKITDSSVAKADIKAAAKEKEIMEI